MLSIVKTAAVQILTNQAVEKVTQHTGKVLVPLSTEAKIIDNGPKISLSVKYSGLVA